MTLQQGMKVHIVEGDEVIDEAVITQVEEDGKAVTIKSLKLHPDQETDFGSFLGDKGQTYWRMLFEDPFTGARCFSQRAAKYQMRPLPEAAVSAPTS